MFFKKKLDRKRVGYNFRSTQANDDWRYSCLENVELPCSKDDLAIPPANVLMYEESPAEYLQSGIRDFGCLRDAIKGAGIALEELPRVLEFGCSNSRVLRHFAEQAFSLSDHEYWGCDIDGDALMWSFTHLSPPFHFFVNSTQPSLPFRDAYFGLIFAYSIFTHMDENFFTWFLELRRAIRKHGFLYLTFQDEHSYQRIQEMDHEGTFRKRVLLEQEKLDKLKDGLWNAFFFDRYQYVNGFFRRDFLLAYFKRYMDVVSVIENTMGGFQTAVLLRNRD